MAARETESESGFDQELVVAGAVGVLFGYSGRIRYLPGPHFTLSAYLGS